MFDTIPYQEIGEQREDTQVVMYGLSFCGHCEEGKAFLSSLGVGFRYASLDTLEAPLRRPVLKALRDRYGRPVLYPVLEVDGEFTFGFEPDAWRAALGGDPKSSQ